MLCYTFKRSNFFFFADVNELKECLYVLVKEQQVLAKKTATTTLSALRLKQRLAILERYFIALNRTVLQDNVKVKWKSSNIPLPAVDKKRYAGFFKNISPSLSFAHSIHSPKLYHYW